MKNNRHHRKSRIKDIGREVVMRLAAEQSDLDPEIVKNMELSKLLEVLPDVKQKALEEVLAEVRIVGRNRQVHNRGWRR